MLNQRVVIASNFDFSMKAVSKLFGYLMKAFVPCHMRNILRQDQMKKPPEGGFGIS